MGTVQFTDKEKKIFVLSIVKSCLDYAKEEGKEFEEVLTCDLFPEEASEAFENLVCKGIETLHKEGYISGLVELVYEEEGDMETGEWENTDTVFAAMCTFENIDITLKGNMYLAKEGFEDLTKDFWVKVKPLIKCIATVALETIVETGVLAGLKAVGFPV